MQTSSASLKSSILRNLTQPKQSYTKQYQKHTPSGFCYYIKCFDDSVCKQEPAIYTKQSEDDDVAQIFFDKLVKDLKEIYMDSGKKKMTITPNQQRKFQKATKCWICGDKLVTHQDYEKKTTSQGSLSFYWEIQRTCS